MPPKETVRKARLVHSFHSYFLRRATAKPIIYDVEVLRDGNGFSARRVTAIRTGSHLFTATPHSGRRNQVFEHQKPCRRQSGQDYRQKLKSSAIAGAFTAAPILKRISLRSPAGNSSRRISQSVKEGHVAALPMRQVWIRRQRHRSGPTFASINIYWGYASDHEFPSVIKRFSLTASVFWKRAFRSPLMGRSLYVVPSSVQF